MSTCQDAAPDRKRAGRLGRWRRDPCAYYVRHLPVPVREGRHLLWPTRAYPRRGGWDAQDQAEALHSRHGGTPAARQSFNHCLRVKMRSIKGKVAIVTGGARSIGAALVRELVLEGASVAIADILTEQGEIGRASCRERVCQYV